MSSHRITYNPNRRCQQAEIDACQPAIGGLDNDRRIQLHSNTNANNPEVHEHKRPQSPVDQDVPEIFQVPFSLAVDTSQVLIVNLGVLASEGWPAGRDPPKPSGAR